VDPVTVLVPVIPVDPVTVVPVVPAAYTTVPIAVGEITAVMLIARA
jgi:hypothetical protein